MSFCKKICRLLICFPEDFCIFAFVNSYNENHGVSIIFCAQKWVMIITKFFV